MSGQLIVAMIALAVSSASFLFAWFAARRAEQAEDIKNLLGDKETVAFGALKLLRDGLPGEKTSADAGQRRSNAIGPGSGAREASKRRALLIGALMSACLFESSDRARALLFSVIERYRETPFRRDFDREYAQLKETVESMKRYQFNAKQFDPGSADLRLDAVRKVLENDLTPSPPRPG